MFHVMNCLGQGVESGSGSVYLIGLSCQTIANERTPPDDQERA